MLKRGLDPKEILQAEEAAKQKALQKQQLEDAKGTLSQLVEAYLENLEKQGKRTGARILKTIFTKTYTNQYRN